ncbi:MAG: hypothetical protein PUJ82_12265 [Spirochaetales bacterium]|nr:hypothetical protein [Spirochaetales bacterium]MDY5916183.1 hypothetical protein [Treponema sp.]
MTLEQEIKLAAKHAYQKAYKEACKKFDKKAEKVYQKAYKEAAVHEKLENAKKLRVAGVSLEIISKCTGLSLEEVEAL